MRLRGRGELKQGLEYRTGSVGVFGELRLYIYVPNLRAGLNIHF